MSPTADPRLQHLLAPHGAAFASAWQAALVAHGCSLGGADRLQAHVCQVTEQVIALLGADSFDAAAAHRIGAALVALSSAMPAALGTTLEVWARTVPAVLPAAPARRLQPRLASVLGAIATGFATELARCRLHDHQPMHQAVRAADNAPEPLACGAPVPDVLLGAREAQRLAVFTRLDHALSTATSAAAAAEVIASAADALVGWDAYSLNLFEPDADHTHVVLNYDVIDGQRTRVAPIAAMTTASAIARRVIADGPLLVLREPPFGRLPGTHAFGDTSRPSASLMFVPIRSERRALGVLTIQSYTPQAYTNDDLAVLQALADHCGGALERMRATAWLQHREATQRALLNALPDAIVRVDRTGRLLDVNGSHPHRRATRATWRGRTVDDVFPLPVAEQVKESIQRALATREEQVVEYARELQGDTHHEEARIVVSGDNEVLGVVREVTERKRVEAARVQARKLDSLGVIAAGIAHEFNNMLMVMRGHAELAQLDLPPDSTAHQHIGQIERTARRAGQLTAQLLTCAGQGPAAFMHLDVTALLEHMHAELAQLVGQRARLVYQLAPDLPAIDGDREHLHHVLRELVANAADASEGADGTIEVRTGSVGLGQAELDALEPLQQLSAGSYVWIEVADNGCGMDAETQANMFDPFFSTKANGSGVSLAAALGMVRAHHGTIQVRSAPGAGTSVRVLLPAAT